MAEFNLERAKSALRNADAAGDAAAARKIANGIKQYMQSSQTQGPVLAHEKVVGGRVADMGTLDKMALGAKTALSKIGAGVAGIADELSPVNNLRDAIGAANEYIDSDILDKTLEYFPQKENPLLQGWRENNDLRTLAVNQAGFPAQATEFGVSLAPDAITAGATRGASLLPRTTAQGVTAAATTDGDMLDRAIAGGLASTGYFAGAGGTRTGRAVNDAWGKTLDLRNTTGRRRNVRRLLESYSDSPRLLPQRIDNRETAPLKGYKYSLAESVPTDQGLAQLQRASLTNNPKFQRRMSGLRDDQNNVILNAFNRDAGRVMNPKTNKTTFDDAVAKRTLNAMRNYGKAENTPLVFSKSAEKRATELLKRPHIQDAVQQARSSARSRGSVMKPEGSIEGLQQVRDTLSRKLKSLNKASDPDLNAIKDVKTELKALDSFLAKVSPDFANAQRTFKADSVDVNRMNIMNLLREKLVPAIDDVSEDAPSRLYANRMISALRDKNSRNMDEARKIVSDATGLNKSLDEVLDGGRMQTLEGIRNTLSRRNKVNSAIKADGSPTTMYGNQQDIMDRLLFPVMNNRAAIPLSRVLGDFIESRNQKGIQLVQAQLAKALADPAYARRVLDTPIKEDWVRQANKAPDWLMRMFKQQLNRKSANNTELKAGAGGTALGAGIDYYIQE